VFNIINRIKEDIDRGLATNETTQSEATHFVPRMQLALRRFLESTNTRLYVFIDDIHYLRADEQPKLLDMIHGAVRDIDAWLKIAGIRHLTRWFRLTTQLGIQTSHDADHIDLDVTLETPTQAKGFLESIVRAYTEHSGISSLSRMVSTTALDRLVLASGAVPRDYLTLTATAIRQAQTRGKAKLVGVQDVNEAAGEAAKTKIAELEDDAASSSALTTKTILNVLHRLREFCLNETNYTYFRIDLIDKDKYADIYSVFHDLMDLRLIHMVESSLSDEREAGRRSEVYMLDLSQFSGKRLRKKLRVLDFEAGHLVLKETGTTAKAKVGSSPNQRLAILRRGPRVYLETFDPTA
jgi:hypothetical protein